MPEPIRRRTDTRIIAIAILVSMSAALAAQRTVSRSVWVSVVDGAGRPALDLAPADFQVTENGVRRDVTRATLGNAPMRIVLMVDSSSAISPMINNFRIGLNAFADALAPEHEIVLISTGGQIRVRTQPSADRARLKAEIARFASEGGANSFMDTLIESDSRFLKNAPGQWPVFVILTTDNGETRREPDFVRYNKFMQDFVARGGAAHAVVVAGKAIGTVTDFATNLVQNVAGMYDAVVVDSNVPSRMKSIADRLTADYKTMINRYEIEFSGDAKAVTPMVNAVVSREGVRLEMSGRRPF